MGRLHFAAPLLIALALGCGGGGSSSGGSNGGSGAECSASVPCPTGEYCDEGGACAADCTVGSDECGEGFSCSLEGRCLANSTNDGGIDGDGGNECASVDLSLTPTVPTVMLLIDQSSSMSQNISGADPVERWGSVRSALVGDGTPGNRGVIGQIDDDVVFGAQLYSAIRNDAENCPHGAATPDIQQGNYDQIATLMENTPTGGTPTEAAIRQRILPNFPAPVEDGPRILLLATDGDPDTCEETDTSPEIQAGVEDAVADAFDDGIETFVLSVGNNVAADHLQRVANEGLGMDRDAGDALVYLATTATQLEDAFDDILIGARDCELDLNGELVIDRAGEGTVTLNGDDLVFGDDWEVIDASTIGLVGEACTTLKTTESVSLSASFPCGAASIIQ